HLEKNVAALDVKLSEGDIGEIRKAADEADIVGERYPLGMPNMSYVDSPPLK
ncbi:hypothetical protein BDZ89DRAFT_945841, partial [Hymenopellis radicata]